MIARLISNKRVTVFSFTRISYCLLGVAYNPRARNVSHRCLSMAAASSSVKRAEDFLSFVNACPSAFHAVHTVKQRLEAAGFKLIREKDPWSASLKPGGKYYFTRNGSSIAAFAIGQKWKPGNPIAMIGAHTDSPCLRVKPVSKKQSDGFLQVGVETYGGGLWHTWFDRDLSVAGRAMVRGKDGIITPKLVRIDRPILRIPTLAIHLDRQETFSFNKESQLFPIAGLVAAELNRQGKGSGSASTETSADNRKVQASPLKAIHDRHHPYVLELIGAQVNADPSDIMDFELVLYDTQKACLGGLNNELIFSARLDNLMMTYCTVESLIASVADSGSLSDETTIRLMSCFDHEEIGSQSAQGADSNLLPALIRRLSIIPSSTGSASSDESFEKLSLEDYSTAYEQTLASSFLISADMAHSVHPNYPAKHESDHRPEMNKGTVLKINANVRYATNAPGIVLLQEAARTAKPSSYLPKEEGAEPESRGVPLQVFVVRNDSSCGSTIGPMLAAALGARTVDLGNPQLSMHSIRETCGAHDAEHAIHLFESFYENYKDLEKRIVVD